MTYAVLLKNQGVGFYDWVRPRLEPDTLGRLWSEELPIYQIDILGAPEAASALTPATESAGE